ncbi:winged helix-turn-helix transcriptional regulator [Streptomyces profundus]|uniref:winged helix-turn-helix transcriptional regulator n=1 Tax=Streptomyces profundus TaxID=2867410 RepID=UPI001D1655F2|nr:helix-turn-helix domain-containing protein [Streptomyces sp. MA3_2.13]UED87481.1 helix-turn-helix transcriptional regulator [Streptomyces sp. MA3_2.13]
MFQRNTDVPVSDVPPEACPLREVIGQVGGKWSAQIIVATADGPIRYTELERRVDGISRRMLTLTLRHLERDGLLVRTVYPTVPPKVEYTLTDMAVELHASLAALIAWAERHGTAISRAREAYDSREDTVTEAVVAPQVPRRASTTGAKESMNGSRTLM